MADSIKRQVDDLLQVSVWPRTIDQIATDLGRPDQLADIQSALEELRRDRRIIRGPSQGEWTSAYPASLTVDLNSMMGFLLRSRFSRRYLDRVRDHILSLDEGWEKSD